VKAQESPLRNIFLENLTEKLLFNFFHPQNDLFFVTNATHWQLLLGLSVKVVGEP